MSEKIWLGEIKMTTNLSDNKNPTPAPYGIIAYAKNRPLFCERCRERATTKKKL